MTKLEYLEKHHYLTQSIVGLVSIQSDIEGVNKVLLKWKPLLDELSTERYKSLCVEEGVEWEDVKSMFLYEEEYK